MRTEKDMYRVLREILQDGLNTVMFFIAMIS